MDIRGVQGAGVLKTLLDRKLIAEAGRKNVVGKPILYKTTKEFLVQFGLKDLTGAADAEGIRGTGTAWSSWIRSRAVAETPVKPRRNRPRNAEIRASEPGAGRMARKCLKNVCRKSSRRPASPAAAKPRN